MAIRDIIKLPDPALRRISKPVEKVTAETRGLMDDMLETMYAAPGIGLAAIQIGVPLRVVTIDLAKEGEPRAPQFFINPEVVWESEALSDYEEGCLSIPEFFELVTRPAEVRIKYLDRNGEPLERHCTGMLATCIQHEIDHLNGVLFIDHISKLKRDRVVKKFAKAKRLEKADA
jgi:peptide deformylase